LLTSSLAAKKPNLNLWVGRIPEGFALGNFVLAKMLKQQT